MKTAMRGSVIAFGLMLMVMPVATAQTVNFPVSATIPQATGVVITATRVDAATNVFGATVTSLSFDPMAFDALNGVWLPDHFFAIDVGVTADGVGSPQVTVTYAEGAIPIGQTAGLGVKSIATFTKISGTPEIQTNLVTHGPKKLLRDVSGELITSGELAGGFLRIFVGIFPGDDPALLAIGGGPFTNADLAGSYTGTLTISGTVI